MCVTYTVGYWQPPVRGYWVIIVTVKGAEYGKLELKHDLTMDILNILWIVIFFWIVWWYCMKEMRMSFGLRRDFWALFSSISLSLSLFSIHITWNCLLCSNFPSLLSSPFFNHFSPLSSITSLLAHPHPSLFFPQPICIYPFLCLVFSYSLIPLYFLLNRNSCHISPASVSTFPTNEWVCVSLTQWQTLMWIFNTRLNCGLAPLCLSHWLASPPQNSLSAVV